MSSTFERLIESWLDSQSERLYQAAFIQLLVSEGWTVLHNTRHSPIELGKDVIARNSRGVLHCFQLKGNPGSRVTKSEAQSLLDQFIELLEISPSSTFRSTPSERHVAVFVTNGDIDEEARLVFEGAGARVKKSTCPARKYELWTRGELLALLRKHSGTIWPASLDGARAILNLFAEDGRLTPDPRIIARVLIANARVGKKLSSAAKSAHLSSLLLLAEIIKAPWYATKNHYALFSITTLVSVYALPLADDPDRYATLERYCALAIEHCADLLTEAKERSFEPDYVWAERDPLSERDIMWERRRLIGDCAAILILSGHKTESRPYIESILESTFSAPRLWGLAAVPSLILKYWAINQARASIKFDRLFGSQLRAIIFAGTKSSKIRSLPTPHYNFEECWAYTNGLPFIWDSSIFKDSFEGRTWFARPMLFMLAKRNYKQTCKGIWSSFSHLVHETPQLPTRTFFDAAYSTEGKLVTYTYHKKEWSELVREAVDENQGRFLDDFSSLAWLIAAYITIVPYRAWDEVLMWLDTQLDRTWYHSGRVP